MAVDTKTIARLRERTGAGVLDAKKALEEAGGDIERAIEVLKEKGAIKAAKKSDREAHEGVIAAYVHHNGKLAALLELACETDFVARTDEFKQLAQDLALQVAAMDPEYVSPEAIPEAEKEAKRTEFMKEIEANNKPEDIKEKIVNGKMDKWYEETCLTKQEFIKDDSKTVEQLIQEKISTIGENIVPTRFERIQMEASPTSC
jgi:elongation factor Ts